MTWVDDRIYAGGGERLPGTWGAFADQTGITAVLHLRPHEPAVVWLASGDCDCVQGATQYIDGGMTLSPEFAPGG